MADDFRAEKKRFFNKVNEVYAKISIAMKEGEKPLDELQWLEGVLAQTIEHKTWISLDHEERHRFLQILLTLNLVREEIKSGKPLGVTPDEVEDSFMRGAEYRKP